MRLLLLVGVVWMAGCISPEEYQRQLTMQLQIQAQEEERLREWLASLTPEQRFQWEMQQERLRAEAAAMEFQAREARRARAYRNIVEGFREAGNTPIYAPTAGDIMNQKKRYQVSPPDMLGGYTIEEQ